LQLAQCGDTGRLNTIAWAEQFDISVPYTPPKNICLVSILYASVRKDLKNSSALRVLHYHRTGRHQVYIRLVGLQRHVTRAPQRPPAVPKDGLSHPDVSHSAKRHGSVVVKRENHLASVVVGHKNGLIAGL
jgi:hypothetical protein